MFRVVEREDGSMAVYDKVSFFRHSPFYVLPPPKDWKPRGNPKTKSQPVRLFLRQGGQGQGQGQGLGLGQGLSQGQGKSQENGQQKRQEENGKRAAEVEEDEDQDQEQAEDCVNAEETRKRLKRDYPITVSLLNKPATPKYMSLQPNVTHTIGIEPKTGHKKLLYEDKQLSAGSFQPSNNFSKPIRTYSKVNTSKINFSALFSGFSPKKLSQTQVKPSHEIPQKKAPEETEPEKGEEKVEDTEELLPQNYPQVGISNTSRSIKTFSSTIACKGCHKKFGACYSGSSAYPSPAYFIHCVEKCDKYKALGCTTVCDKCNCKFISDRAVKSHRFSCRGVLSK